MRFDPPEPKGKLDTMTGYSWSIPAVATAPVVVNGPEDVVPDWDVVEWRRHEGNVGRLRQRIFTGLLELPAVKAARAVLRGDRRGNPLVLPDVRREVARCE